MSKRDGVLVGLCLIAIIILASTLLLLDPAIHARFLEVVDAIGHGIVLLFVVGLALVSAAAGVKIWKMFSTHVVKDGKDGQIARAVVYKGVVVQLGSAEGFGLNELLQMQGQLIAQQQKTLQVVEIGRAHV